MTVNAALGKDRHRETRERADGVGFKGSLPDEGPARTSGGSREPAGYFQRHGVNP